MKKIVLILALVMLSVSAVSAKVEANVNGIIPQNNAQAQENAAQKMQAELEKIEKQINENLKKGKPVDELEQKLQKLSAKIKASSPYERLRKIDKKIADAASEGQPIEALEQKRQKIIEEINIMENAQH